MLQVEIWLRAKRVEVMILIAQQIEVIFHLLAKVLLAVIITQLQEILLLLEEAHLLVQLHQQEVVVVGIIQQETA